MGIVAGMQHEVMGIGIGQQPAAPRDDLLPIVLCQESEKRARTFCKDEGRGSRRGSLILTATFAIYRRLFYRW